MDDIERRHQQALERQRNAHDLSQQRAADKEQRRADGKIQAQLGDLEAMRLKHELDIENRGYDHEFNRAEDARELERLATEEALRRRSGFLDKALEDDARAQVLEGELLKKVADHKIALRQEEQRHGHLMTEKAVDQDNMMADKFASHQNAKEMAVLANELDKDNFEFKQRLQATLNQQGRQMDEAEIKAIMSSVRAASED